VRFSPPLPREKVSAIQRLGMGTENKVILRFKKVFWPADEPYLQTTEVPLRIINGHYFGKANTLIVHISPQLDYQQWSNERLLEHVVSNIKSMFGIKRLPDIVDHCVTRWETDEFSLGSYSYMHKGSNSQHIRDLAEPSHGGRVLWAGEACSVEGQQCVHGAYISGEEAAGQILDTLAKEGW